MTAIFALMQFIICNFAAVCAVNADPRRYPLGTKKFNTRKRIYAIFSNATKN